MNAYRIKDWNDIYENNRTRTMKHMRWVPVPNGHDGYGYSCLVDHKNGAAHLGVWLAVLQVASKCDTRGTLMRDERHPHDAASLARMTRLSDKLISEALVRLASPDIAWLEVVDSEGLAPTCHESGTILTPDCPSADEEGRKGIEGNGIEGKEEMQGIPEALDNPQFKDAWDKWTQHRKEKRSALTPLTIKQQLSKLDGMGVKDAITAIERSITNGWIGIFDSKEGGNNGKPHKQRNTASLRDAESDYSDI